MVPNSLPPACVLLISCVPLASPFWVSFSPPVKVGGRRLDPGRLRDQNLPPVTFTQSLRTWIALVSR